MIKILVAFDENKVIGKNNALIWHLPADLQRFKALTTGHVIIMGRKTFESFPKPLPNRTHVIITRQNDFEYEGCVVVQNIEKALSVCPINENLYIIGGGEIYQQSISFADQLDITRVHHSFDADVYFPEIDPEIWELTSETFHQKDERHLFDYTFQTFVRKK